MLRKLLPKKCTPLLMSSIFYPRLLSNSKCHFTQGTSQKNQHSEREFLKLLGVDSLNGPLPIVDRPTHPGEYAISRERRENIFKHKQELTEEELKAAGDILKEASRQPFSY